MSNLTCENCDKGLSGRQRKFCSINCKTYVHLKAWRKRTKLRAVQHKGGCCTSCGYAGNAAAMVFHHEGNKSFGVGGSAIASWSRIEEELKKCVLLCLNCHAEEHYPDLRL